MSPLGSGGMRSKVVAAEMATAAGIATVIGSGFEPGTLTRAWAGERVGTRFAPQAVRHSSFKLWLKYAKPAQGGVTVDAGAARALREGGTSLLPVGIVDVAGEFDAGDAVRGAARRGRGHRQGDLSTTPPASCARVHGHEDPRRCARSCRARPTRPCTGTTSCSPDGSGRAGRGLDFAAWPSRPSPSPSSAGPPRPLRGSSPRSTPARRTAALLAVADALVARTPEILEANARDLEAGRESGLSAALMDRLALDGGPDRGDGRAACATIVALPDPVGEVLDGVPAPERARRAQGARAARRRRRRLRGAAERDDRRRGAVPEVGQRDPAARLLVGGALQRRARRDRARGGRGGGPAGGRARRSSPAAAARSWPSSPPRRASST